jgi:hypothetical protein
MLSRHPGVLTSYFKQRYGPAGEKETYLYSEDFMQTNNLNKASPNFLLYICSLLYFLSLYKCNLASQHSDMVPVKTRNSGKRRKFI